MMQKLFTRKNILIAVVIAVISAIFAIALMLPSTVTAGAEGNEGGNLNKAFDVSLKMDLNGKDAATDIALEDRQVSNLSENDTLKLRKRRLYPAAIVDAYNQNTEHENLPSRPSGYYLIPDSAVIDTTAVSVSIASNGRTMDVTAVSTATQARFTVCLGESASATTKYTVSFEVTVTDTFVQYDGDAGWEFDPALAEQQGGRNLLIGSALNTNYTERNKHTGGEHAALKYISNNSNFEINLGELLKNHSLYARKAGDTNQYQYSQPLLMNADDPDTMWGLGSVQNIKVDSISLQYITAFEDITYTNPNKYTLSSGATLVTKVDPVVKATLSLNTSKISSYCSSRYSSEISDSDERVKKFWADTHFIEIRVRAVGEDTTTNQHTLILPVKFTPASPQYVGISADNLRLNVKSPYAYEISTTDYYNNTDDTHVDNPDRSKGKSAIIIRPTDLVDYSAPYDWANNSDHAVMRFIAEETSSNIPNRLEITKFAGNDDSRPTAYKVAVLDNRNYIIDLGIEYYVASGEVSTTPMRLSLSISGFGNYSIRMESVRGRSERSYNVITSSIFAELISNGYQMTNATSTNLDIIDAQFSDNTLTLNPRANGEATIEFEFTNTSSDVIKVVSEPFSVDVNANDFFASFDADWQAWLVIAGIVLGGILIILLIVWIFIHSISKHKQEEAATQAPVSSYIVKLNSTIAATQAQQRLVATQALTQASGQMLLGAGPAAGPAPNPDTLQLASGVPSTPGSAPEQTVDSTPSSSPAMSEPRSSEPQANDEESREDLEKLIAQYISDEELLERIFTEKYEPKGMVRRTFFKSKDLQARELEKEKTRIIDRYKSPMPMDEAIRSENELKKAEQSSAPSEPAEETVEEDPSVIDLGFDVDAPLYAVAEPVKDEFSEEKIEFDVAPEESRLKEIEKKNDFLQKELAELKSRMDIVTGELNKNKSLEQELEEKIAKAEADNEQYAKDIEDLEFKLASARNKEKDKINRDIKINEERTERNKRDIEKWQAELDKLRTKGSSLSDIMAKLNATKDQKDSEQQGITSDLDKAKSDFAAYQERLAQVKARQELAAKIEGLSPLLLTVNTADYEIRQIDNLNEHLEKERSSLKSDIAGAKAQILNANDFDIINELNSTISSAQSRLSEIEKDITKSTKRKSELNIELRTSRNGANDFVEKNNIPLEDVISAEDAIIGNIEFEHLKLTVENDRDEAEKAVAAAQAVYDDLSASSGDVTMIAMEIAAGIKDIEDELNAAQAELDAINMQMEEASDDDKLMLIVDQGEKADKVEELKEKLNQANVDGTKRKMEAQGEYDAKLDVARHNLDEANEEFKKSCVKFDNLMNMNPLDLIMSGSGIISQDQKKIEAENLKKQLEKSKNEIEQARLAAEMAQMEAEQARVEAARATDEAKAEAERKAQEAMEAAEQAKREAEEKARSEAEAAEMAKRQAEEAAEQVKREAEEAIIAAKREAEEATERARREAEEAAEQARREAEEAAEQARREAEEAAEQAKREAEEAAEQARLEHEAQIQAEAEEAKRKAQEEIDEMRRKAEEEAEQKRKEEEERAKAEEEKAKAEAERKEAIAKKIATRKEQIIEIRNGIKELKNEDEAKNLREKLYTSQLSYDEDERGSSELMDFYNKTMDDIQHAGEVATLKAENAKKPQRVIKKVTERVNRIPKRKPGARPSGAKAGARPAARPGARPSGARPAARPGARPAARPGARPSGTRPSGTRPTRRP